MKPSMILCDVGGSRPSFPMHLTLHSACDDDSILSLLTALSITYGVQRQLRLTTTSTLIVHLLSSQPATSSSSHIYRKAMGTPDKYFWTPNSDVKIEEYVKKVSSTSFFLEPRLTHSSAPPSLMIMIHQSVKLSFPHNQAEKIVDMGPGIRGSSKRSGNKWLSRWCSPRSKANL